MKEIDKIEKLKSKLKHDIKAIENKLKKKGFGKDYINDYRKIRLRAFKRKMTEILEFLEDKK